MTCDEFLIVTLYFSSGFVVGHPKHFSTKLRLTINFHKAHIFQFFLLIYLFITYYLIQIPSMTQTNPTQTVVYICGCGLVCRPNEFCSFCVVNINKSATDSKHKFFAYVRRTCTSCKILLSLKLKIWTPAVVACAPPVEAAWSPCLPTIRNRARSINSTASWRRWR